MMEWYETLTTLQKTFLLFASVGGVVFLIRMVMMFMGMGDEIGDGMDGDLDGDLGGNLDGDMDGDMDGDDGLDEDTGDGSDSDLSFRLLSLQGLMAFFMMFGLTGLAMSKESDFGALASIVGGTVAGLVTVYVIKALFRVFNNLQSSGTLNLKNAVGEEGTVYLSIPEEQAGKVRVEVQGHLKVMEAVSQDGSRIPTDTRVRVASVVNGNVLVVTRI